MAILLKLITFIQMMDIIYNFLDSKVFYLPKIAKNSTIQPKNKVVYLQHGLQDSSDTWVVN